MGEVLRKCKDCGLEACSEEELELFVNAKDRLYGRRNLCKRCAAEYAKQHYHDNRVNKPAQQGRVLRKCRTCGLEAYNEEGLELFVKGTRTLYGRRNLCKECKSEYAKQYYQGNREKYNEHHKRHYQGNREKRLAYQKLYFQDNRAKIGARDNRRRKSDPQFRLGNLLRSRLHTALRAQTATKQSKTLDLIGCTIPELIAHLEQTAQRNYNIEFDFRQHYNGKQWHIDHVKPLSSFDLTDPEQQAQAMHYANLQILTAEDNLRKHSKIEG